MPRTRKALIKALHAWCEMQVEAGDVDWFDMKTILWMHMGPDALPCRPFPTSFLQNMWNDVADAEAERLSEIPE